MAWIVLGAILACGDDPEAPKSDELKPLNVSAVTVPDSIGADESLTVGIETCDHECWEFIGFYAQRTRNDLWIETWARRRTETCFESLCAERVYVADPPYWDSLVIRVSVGEIPEMGQWEIRKVVYIRDNP
jgi:hypothetical protein